MTYSYTQISQYLSCPRRYRHRYLDGWQEKDTRTAMLFGRGFEQAVAALFRREDRAAVLFKQWGVCKDMGLTYSGNDTWDRMLQQGVQLLERFAQGGRVRIRRPRSNQQIQFNRTLGSGNTFVSYVDAIGELDGTACVLEWKTTGARYPEEPAGISALDPQLVCYSWMTGIDEVAQVVFVRKRLVEVQYLRATISDEQRQEFATLVEDTVRRVESGLFLPHSGIRFPQNPVIEQAVETAALMLGSDKSRGYCLEMICADFLAGAHLDNGNPEILLQSISRYYRFMPGEQRQAFLENLLEKAS